MVVREHVKHRATYTPSDSIHMRSQPNALDEQTTTFANVEKLLLYCDEEILLEICDYALGNRPLGGTRNRHGLYFEAQLHKQISLKHDIAEIQLSISQDLWNWKGEATRKLQKRLSRFAAQNGIALYFM